MGKADIIFLEAVSVDVTLAVSADFDQIFLRVVTQPDPREYRPGATAILLASKLPGLYQINRNVVALRNLRSKTDLPKSRSQSSKSR